MHTIEVRHFFDAAHQLVDSDDLVTKQCARLHGHTYAVIVKVSAPALNGAGMVVDFKVIKNAIDTLDHGFINDEFKWEGGEWATLQPTAENIASFIVMKLRRLSLNVASVSICEGYKGQERSSWVHYENNS